MKHLSHAIVFLAATLPAVSLAAQDAPPGAATVRTPCAPRSRWAAPFVDAFRRMPGPRISHDGTEKFYGFLGDLYKAQTKDPVAAKEAAAAAIARFAEYSAYLRDMPMAFDEVAGLLAKARAAGARDPMLDLVETMNHNMAKHTYLLPCFKPPAMSAMRDRIRAEYGPGIPLMLAQLAVLHAATDERFSAVDAFGREKTVRALPMEAVIGDYGAVVRAAAQRAGIQQGLLDCWLFAVNGNLALDAAGITPLGEPADPRATMFWFKGKSFRAKHDLFWSTDWSKFAPHPDLGRGLKAAQDIKQGWEARGGGYANTVTDAGGRKFDAAIADANGQVAAMDTPMGSVGVWLQLHATGPACSQSYVDDLVKVILAGDGPYLIQAVDTTTFYHLGRWGGDVRKNLRTLEHLLDAAVASDRDDIAAPAIDMVTIGINTLQMDDGEAWDELCRKRSFREDFATLYGRALAWLAKCPEPWARVRERCLFARRISLLCAGGPCDPQQYVDAHRLVARDGASGSPLLDPACFRTRYGAGWRQALDKTMALGDPVLGERIAALDAADWPQDAESLAGQIKEWNALLAEAKDPLTRPFVLAQARRREQAAAFTGDKTHELPFDAEHWLLDAPAGKDGSLAAGPMSRATALVPLVLGVDQGFMLDFDLVNRVDGPQLCLQFQPVVTGKAPSFSSKPGDAPVANILVCERGSTQAWAMRSTKQRDGKVVDQAIQTPLVAVDDGEKSHVRLECWSDRTLVWINHRMVGHLVPATRMTGPVQVAFTAYAGRILDAAPSCISGVRVTPLGASPHDLAGEAAEIWAKEAIARDPGHEAAWVMRLEEGKWTQPVPPEVVARLRLARYGQQLESFLKTHPMPVVKLVPAVRRPGEQWLATANSEEFDALARFAADGNPKTSWHDTWRGWSGPFPQLLRVDTAMVRPVRGVRVQKRDGFDAPPAWMFLETSEDGVTWAPQAWSKGWTPFKRTKKGAPSFLDIPFPATVKARYLRITFFGSNHFNGYVTVAEVTPLLEAERE